MAASEIEHRSRTVSLRTLIVHDDAGLWKTPTTYPDLTRYNRHHRAIALQAATD